MTRPAMRACRTYQSIVDRDLGVLVVDGGAALSLTYRCDRRVGTMTIGGVNLPVYMRSQDLPAGRPATLVQE